MAGRREIPELTIMVPGAKTLSEVFIEANGGKSPAGHGLPQYTLWL